MVGAEIDHHNQRILPFELNILDLSRSDDPCTCTRHSKWQLTNPSGNDTAYKRDVEALDPRWAITNTAEIPYCAQ